MLDVQFKWHPPERWYPIPPTTTTHHSHHQQHNITTEIPFRFRSVWEKSVHIFVLGVLGLCAARAFMCVWVFSNWIQFEMAIKIAVLAFAIFHSQLDAKLACLIGCSVDFIRRPSSQPVCWCYFFRIKIDTFKMNAKNDPKWKLQSTCEFTSTAVAFRWTHAHTHKRKKNVQSSSIYIKMDRKYNVTSSPDNGQTDFDGISRRWFLWSLYKIGPVDVERWSETSYYFGCFIVQWNVLFTPVFFEPNERSECFATSPVLLVSLANLNPNDCFYNFSLYFLHCSVVNRARKR